MFTIVMFATIVSRDLPDPSVVNYAILISMHIRLRRQQKHRLYLVNF